MTKSSLGRKVFIWLACPSYSPSWIKADAEIQLGQESADWNWKDHGGTLLIGFLLCLTFISISYICHVYDPGVALPTMGCTLPQWALSKNMFYRLASGQSYTGISSQFKLPLQIILTCLKLTKNTHTRVDPETHWQTNLAKYISSRFREKSISKTKGGEQSKKTPEVSHTHICTNTRLHTYKHTYTYKWSELFLL